MADKKMDIASLVLAHAKAKKGAAEEPEADEDEGDADAGITSAMDDLIEAVHGKDTAGAVAAYKALRECE